MQQAASLARTNDTLSADSLVARTTDGLAPAMHEYLFLVLKADEPSAHHVRLSLANVSELHIGRGARDRVELRPGAVPGRLELGLPDAWCSKQHVVMIRTRGGWVVHDVQSKNGSMIDGHRIREAAALPDGALLEVGRTFFIYRQVSDGPSSVGAEPLTLGPPPSAADLFRTLSPTLEHQLGQLRRAAPTALPVLIRGESGTGKEVAARALHELSGRRGPFVAVNCGALSPGLLESELFGHVRGAFSGATDSRVGLVRAAHQGTLFLDELAEAPHAVQVRMLRVLQEREVLAVGATTPAPVDVRVIAATHGDVHALAARGEFRPDFLARLTGFEIRLPPLRARREDIGQLTAGFLRAARGDRSEMTIDGDVARALLRHPWRLNVRELERLITAAAAMATDGRLSLDAFGDRLERPAEDGPVAPVIALAPVTPEIAGPRGSREDVVAALRTHRGNISGAARTLRTSRTHVRRLILRHGISVGDLR